MNKAILILSLLVAPIFCTSVMAQIKIKGKASNVSQILPKKECEVNFQSSNVSITGHNDKRYTLVRKDDKFSNYDFTFEKTGGRAKTTVGVYVDSYLYHKWIFDRGNTKEKKTIALNDMKGKEVILTVDNHSVTDRIIGKFTTTVNTNSMLSNGAYSYISNETLTHKITAPFSISLQNPCNDKGTVEVTRLNGTSSAELVVTQGSTVLKAETIASSDTSIRLNLHDLNNNNGPLRLEIRNIETNKFIKARIGAWFN